LSRHGIDISRADIRVQKGTCYIRGFVAAMPGAKFADLEAEMQRLAHIVRQKPDVRNVILEISHR
jgi:hypothetical protein